MSSPSATLSPRFSRIAVFLLAILGVQAWLILGNGDYGHRHEFWWIAGAVILGLIPVIRRALDQIWEAAADFSCRKRLIVAAIISLLSIPLILWTERYQQIDLRLHLHDEFSYWLQMHMLAHGRLWMPALPLPDFFDSFYILVRPVYASIYFPGTALLFVPTIWLHLPFFVGPLIAAGICVGLFYLIVSEILDGGCALLAVILLLSVGLFRLMSVSLLSEMPMLLMGLAMVFAFLRWRTQMSLGWAIALGVATGWAAIIRPIDAVCFALAIAISMILDLCKKPLQIQRKTVAGVLLGISPFLGLQLIFNHGLTGQWLLTPHSYYTDQNFPGPNFGFSRVSTDVPHVSDIPQKQAFFEGTMAKERLKHQSSDEFRVFRERFNFTFGPALADAFFWILIPLSLLAIWNRRLWALWGAIPFFLACYTWYVWYRQPYSLSVFPAVILLVLIPVKYLSAIFPSQRAAIRTILGLSIAGLALASFPQFDRLARDQYFHMTELAQIDADLSAQVAAPAIVLFHFNPGVDNPEEEPVFNSDVAWPDDAPIIRAHDRNADDSAIGTPGDRNRDLYEYYLRRTPNSVIYLYDRNGRKPILRSLGTPNQLLAPANAYLMNIH